MTMAIEIGKLADIHDLLAKLPAADTDAIAACHQRDITLTKPPGALGRLEEIVAWLSAWQRRHPPRLARVEMHVFAGWHGVAENGLSAFPPTVTAQMVANFKNGGAAINQLCRTAGATLEVTPIAPGRPTVDFREGPAMTEAETVAAINIGLLAATERPDLIGIGEMGIGNTSSASAMSAALFGGDGAAWAGPGTGLDAAGVARKATAVDEALRLHGAELGDPLQVLRRLGGREIAAMTGAILGTRLQGVPTLLDGFVVGAAAAVLHCLKPGSLDHCRAAHRSAEPAHDLLLRKLDLSPLLDLGMRLGEGSGAALAINVIRGALGCHTGMASFSQAGVSGRV